MTRNRIRSTIAAIATAALTAAGIIVTPMLASASPGDPGSVQWLESISESDLTYWTVLNAEDWQAADMEWASTRSDNPISAAPASASASCYGETDGTRVRTGLVNHPDFGTDFGWKPLISLSAHWSNSSFVGAGSRFSIDLMGTDCADTWDLSGAWALPYNGLRSDVALTRTESIGDPESFDTAGHGSDGVIVTPLGWLTFADSTQADYAVSALYLQTNSGDWVEATLQTQISTPSITPTPATIAASVDEPLTIDLATVLGEVTLGGDTIQLFPCSMSDSGPCNPDGVTFGSLPDGATGDVNGPVTWTPTAPGSYPFTYALSDSVSGAVSEFVTGTIEVAEDAADAVLSDHAWTLVLGQTLTISAPDLAAGCEYHNAFTGAATGISCVSTVVGSLELVTSPEGATVATFIDGADETRFESLTFTPTAAGTYEITHRAHYSKGWTNVGVGVITVTAPPVAPPVDAPKPYVTG